MATDNKLIKDKIDTLENLPVGYSPNLENKWDILQATFEQNGEKKSRKLYWMKVSTAAAILIISGSLYLYFTINNVPSAETTFQFEKVTPINTQAHKSDSKKTNVKRRKPARLKPQATVSIFCPETISVEQPINIEDKPKQLVSAQILPKEQSRFVEIDFFDPVLSPQTPTETIVKANQFRFKIHIGNNKQHLNVQNSSSNSVGLKANF